MEMADQIVQSTIDIINHFQTGHWFIENQKTGLLNGRPFMKEYAYVDVDYCQFSSWGTKNQLKFGVQCTWEI